jgi:hypothetical protein
MEICAYLNPIAAIQSHVGNWSATPELDTAILFVQSMHTYYDAISGTQF